MTIRDVDIKDIDNGLVEVYEEGFNYHLNARPDIFIKKDRNEITQEVIDTINDDNKKILVIDDNEKIIGFIIFQIKNKHTKKIYIDQLVIKEDQRGKGLGKLLINEIEQIAKNENCKRIEFDCWAFNNNAFEMYKHLGYKEQLIKFEKEVK